MSNKFEKRIRKMEENFHDLATKSYDTKAIERDEGPSDSEAGKYRTEFQRDRDRIIHSTAFSTLEVMQIARTIARYIGANEDLVEAIALGHDLGHTPFGHIGEEALSDSLKKYGLNFKHNVQSWRIITYLESYVRFPKGGLNLTKAVQFGILRHSGSYSNGREECEVWDKDGNKKNISFKQTLEEKIVRIADDIAWLNHDWEDGVRSGLLSYSLLGEELINGLGPYQTTRINNMIIRILVNFKEEKEIDCPFKKGSLEDKLHKKIDHYLWHNEIILRYNAEAKRIIKKLFVFFVKNPNRLPKETREKRELDNKHSDKKKIAIVVADYISGMSDDWCLRNYETYIYSPYSTFKKLESKKRCEWLKLQNTGKVGSVIKIEKPEDLVIKKGKLFIVVPDKLKDMEKVNSKLSGKTKGEVKFEDEQTVKVKRINPGEPFHKGDLLIISKSDK